MEKINFAAVFTAISLMLSLTIVAQKKEKPKRPFTRNVVWFAPTKANSINGMCLSSFNSDMFYKNDSVKINGVNIEADPVLLFIVPQIIIGSANMMFVNYDSTKRRRLAIGIPDTTNKTKNIVNGVSLGLLGSVPRNFNGLSVSSLINGGDKFNGIAIAGSVNSFYNFNGISIAGIANNAYKGNGIQIGLFNRCIECNGIQIGLLNKMGKRTLPFINMRFKS